MGFNLLAAESHQNADDAFGTLEGLCFEDFDRCDLGPDGTYLNPQIEALYQTSLHYDREARTWLIVGETALVASATMFVWELTRHTDKPDNIPFEPEVRSLKRGDRDRAADCLVGHCGKRRSPSAGPEQLDCPGIATHRPLPQPLVVWTLQGRVGGDEPARDFPGLLQQVGIRRQLGMSQLESARLSSPDQVAHPALLQIQLRDPEPVRRRGEGREPGRRFGRPPGECSSSQRRRARSVPGAGAAARARSGPDARSP